MDWLKVVFVMVAVGGLDTIQSENNTTNDHVRTTALCKAASGCRNDSALILDLTALEPISTIQSKAQTDSCYQFTKAHDSFIVRVNESLSSDCEYDLLSESSTPLYYINGTTLSQIRTQCPEEQPVCVEETPQDDECPENFLVESVFNYKYDFINLQLSWDKTARDERVTIRIHQKVGPDSKKDCYEEALIVNHSLQDNRILKPNSNTEREVNPGCAYDIHMNSEHSEEERFSCNYNYTVPECVGNKCDCDKFGFKPEIFDVEEVVDGFLVTWGGNQSTTNGSPYFYKAVNYRYVISNKSDEELVKWTKNHLKNHTSEIKMDVLEGVRYELIGTFKNNFSCLVEARYGFEVPKSRSYTVYIVCVVVGIAVVILSALQYRSFSKYKSKFLNFVSPGRRRRNQHLQELVTIQNRQILMDTNIHYTPVEFLEGVFDEYEFPRNKIIIKEVIGSGAFGQVYSAKAIGIGGVEGHRIVAVKTLGEGENITKEAATDFIAEIEIFKKIGHHPNIVAFLGCCTADPPYMMIMEFVPCGDLKNYLVDLRTQWSKKRNIATKTQFFFPDSSDGAYIEPPTPTTPLSVTSSRLPSTSETVSTTLEDLLTPSPGPYTLDKALDHTELQNFAFQIARGMSHLEKIGVTHRDLAARNILVNEYKTLKISDFGLSRSGTYVNHRTKKLPLRWMAIEAIVEQKYDSKTDVWSFGVVLWEIGTLGAFPYESVPDSFIQQFLQLGRRLERPEICTDELYALMRLCWATDPGHRPTFQELVEALDVKKRKIYVNFDQLNPTYVFPPSDIERFAETPVQIVDISLEDG
ncbi:receptor-type tyrosine-protein kinase FLT3-like isoform X3 [Zophobas morio]|uniref:receptor-type tyrosine-protein kinase FLT3-like isoform X3 n=1 Tax=Zophobas morio TaxID=2755281 RepID=UPI0030828FDD